MMHKAFEGKRGLTPFQLLVAVQLTRCHCYVHLMTLLSFSHLCNPVQQSVGSLGVFLLLLLLFFSGQCNWAELFETNFGISVGPFACLFVCLFACLEAKESCRGAMSARLSRIKTAGGVRCKM